MVVEASFRRRIWILMFCMCIQIIFSGLVVSFSIMFAEIVQVFDAKRAEAVVMQGLFSGIAGSAGIFVQPIITKYGPGPCAAFGAIVCSIGLSLNFFVSSVGMIIFLAGVVAGIGFSFPLLSSYICVSWMFHEHAGAALVALSIGQSIGLLSFASLEDIMIEQFQWNGAFLLLGAIVLHCVPTAMLMYTCRSYYKKSNHTENGLFKKERSMFNISVFRDVAISLTFMNKFLMHIFGLFLQADAYGNTVNGMKVKVVYLYFDSDLSKSLIAKNVAGDVIGILASINREMSIELKGNTEQYFFVDVLMSRGFDRRQGALLLTVIAVGKLIGRVLGTVIEFKSKSPTIYHWVYLCPLLAVGHILAVQIRDLNTLKGAVAVYSVFYGTVDSLATAILFEVGGRDNYPHIHAWYSIISGVGKIICNVLGGVIKDVYGKYDPIFYLSAAVALVNSLISLYLSVIQKRRNQSVNNNEYELVPIDDDELLEDQPTM